MFWYHSLQGPQSSPALANNANVKVFLKGNGVFYRILWWPTIHKKGKNKNCYKILSHK